MILYSLLQLSPKDHEENIKVRRNLYSWLKKQKATVVHDDLLNLFLDGKKKKLTDIGFGFLGLYWNRFFGLILDRLI